MSASTPLTHASMCCRAKGGPKRRFWRKIHSGIDEQTLEIHAIEVTSSSISPFHGLQTNHCRAMDVSMLPDLLDQIPRDQEIGTVTGESAYDPQKCHDVIVARNANAVIPPGSPRESARPGLT